MNQLCSLPTALCLPNPEIEALIQGRTIAAMPKMFIRPGQRFSLYPVEYSSEILSIEQYYNTNLLPIAQNTIKGNTCETVSIKAWAKCDLCQIIDTTTSLNILSKSTIWTKEAFETIIQKQKNIFLAYLRVYHLSHLCEFAANPNLQGKLGKFVSLPNVNASDDKPVLNNHVFSQRRKQLEKLEPPKHPELEELQSYLTQISNTNPSAQELDDDIKRFIGWSDHKHENTDPDLVWIAKIAEIGNSSDGQTFEKLVRRGLLKLGFTGSGMNPDATGGAGGMDFYAEAPFAIVGECKATKTEKVSDGTPAQLLKIGVNHLGKFQYEQAIKLIVAAGELNDYALRTATQHYMNVICPETLQKLVELQAHYKNSINLLELKEHLQQAPFGLADNKIQSYIHKVEQNIRLRSHIIQLVKKHLEKTGDQNVVVDALQVAYIYDNPPQPLISQELHEILIELSSPLTGYLGRTKGSDWRSDRFYYLRDLPINE